MFLNNSLNFNNNETKQQQKQQQQNKNMSGKMPTSDDFYALVADILTTFTNIIRAAFIPHTFKQKNMSESGGSEKAESGKSLIMSWPIKHDAKIISQILPHCLRICRSVGTIFQILKFLFKLIKFFLMFFLKNVCYADIFTRNSSNPF